MAAAVVCTGPPLYYIWKGPGSPWTTVKQSVWRIEQGFTAVAGRWALFAGGEAQPQTPRAKLAQSCRALFHDGVQTG